MQMNVQLRRKNVIANFSKCFYVIEFRLLHLDILVDIIVTVKALILLRSSHLSYFIIFSPLHQSCRTSNKLLLLVHIVLSVYTVFTVQRNVCTEYPYVCAPSNNRMVHSPEYPTSLSLVRLRLQFHIQQKKLLHYNNKTNNHHNKIK